MWNQRVQVLAKTSKTIASYEALIAKAGFEVSRVLQAQVPLPNRLPLLLDAVLVVFPLHGSQHGQLDSLLSLPQRPAVLIVVEKPSGQVYEQETLQRADDFLYSPFSTEELLLRLRKLLRESKGGRNEKLSLQQSLLSNDSSPPSPQSVQDMIAEAASEAAVHLQEIANSTASRTDWIVRQDHGYKVDYEQASIALFHSDDQFQPRSTLEGSKPRASLQQTQAIPQIQEVDLEELLPDESNSPTYESLSSATIDGEGHYVETSSAPSFSASGRSHGAQEEHSKSDALSTTAESPTVQPPAREKRTKENLPRVHFRDSGEVPYEMLVEEELSDSKQTYLDVRAIDSAELLTEYRNPDFSNGAIIAKTTLSYDQYVEPATTSASLEGEGAADQKHHTLDYESKPASEDVTTDQGWKRVGDQTSAQGEESRSPQARTSFTERSVSPVLSSIKPDEPAAARESEEPLQPSLRVPAPQPLRTGTRPSTPAMNEALLKQQGASRESSSSLPGDLTPAPPSSEQQAASAPAALTTPQVAVNRPAVTGRSTLKSPSDTLPAHHVSYEEISEFPREETPPVASDASPQKVPSERTLPLPGQDNSHSQDPLDAWLEGEQEYSSFSSQTAMSHSHELLSSSEMPGLPNRFSPLRYPLLFSIAIGVVFAITVVTGLRTLLKKMREQPPAKRVVAAKKTPAKPRVRPALRRAGTPPTITPRVRPLAPGSGDTAPAVRPREVASAPRVRPAVRQAVVVRRTPAKKVTPAPAKRKVALVARPRPRPRLTRRPPPRPRRARVRRVARRKSPPRRRAARKGRSVRRLVRSARRLVRRGGKSNFRKAKRLLLRAKQSAPRNLAVIVQLGKVEYELENTAAAIRYLRQAVRRSARGTGDGLVTLGAIYYEKKRVALARKYYGLFLRYYPRSRTASEVRYILKTLK